MPTNPMASRGEAGHAGAGGHMGQMGGGHMGMVVSSEFDYPVHMIPHHEEAIVAATLLQQGSDRQEMRASTA